MDLRELEQYRLEDAVKFHDHLNPKIWSSDEQMRPEVRDRLLQIADDFREHLGVDVAVEDITISGSNAAYTYTPHSDIDLHLIVRLPQSAHSDIYRELFDAKKYQYNDQNDFRIGSYDIELYVQEAGQPHHSQGIYSIMHDRWISVPRRRRPEIDDMSVRSKYEDMGARVDQAIASGDLDLMDSLARKIKTMRQSGLETTGEFSAENLAFKVLRNNGTLQKLRQARQAARDKNMSLSERKKKRRSRRRWGVFGGYYYPGYGYGSGESSGDAGGGGESRNEDYDPNRQPPGPETKPEMPAGTVLVNVSDVYDWYKLGQDISDLSHANPNAYGKGAPQTVLSFGSEPIEHMYKRNLDRLGMKTLDIDRKAKRKDPEGAYRMDEASDTKSLLEKFVAFTARQLGIAQLPHIKFRRDPAWSQRNNTFGRYQPENNTLTVSLAQRHPLDVMRTIAHELTHHWQNEQGSIPAGAGETGSDYENQANARAGEIMRGWANLHPDNFGMEPTGSQRTDEGLRQNLGALATAACVAGTPGCATTGSGVADVVGAAQTVGRAAQATRPYGNATRADILRAAAQEELGRVIKDWIRHSPYPLKTDTQEIQRESDGVVADDFSGQYDTIDLAFSPEYDAAIQNFVEKYKYERFWFVHPRPAVKYDIAYLSIAKTEQLLQVRRFGTISHYDDPRAQTVMVTVPVEKERAFITAMKSLSIPVKKQEVSESSGYIPTQKQRNDPRFKMALTHDVRPGETGRQANRLSLKTNSQGQPQLLMKKLGNLLESLKEEDLFEVKMSPNRLRQWAESPEAEGIRAGFEAELIFRGTETDEDDADYEPNYDMDTRADWIDDVIEFFQSGELGIGRSTGARLASALEYEYNEWRQRAIDEQWRDDAEDQVRDYMEVHIWEDESLRDTYFEQARQDLDLKDQSDLTPEQIREIEIRARELFDANVEDQIETRGHHYHAAHDDYVERLIDDDEFGEPDFFKENYPRMTSIARAFDIEWPYFDVVERGVNRSTNDIAESLADAVGMPVKSSSGYHTATRKPGLWIIEPDGSLEPDDESQEAGLEIVSPPMPLLETLKKLQQVIDWANNEGNAYTNRSTGLHMGISIPGLGGDVDYVKLVLFMGDKYVLETFKRLGNSYCRSALEKLRSVQRGRLRAMTGQGKTAEAMNLMRKNLIELARQLVQEDVGLGKYTSAHIQDGYIEFRSPGGDYLQMNAAQDQILGDTMLRFARAMYIAGHPDLERKEYSTKLYKLLSGFKEAETAKTGKDTRYHTTIKNEGTNDALELFAQYSSGMINSEDLKQKWAEQVLAKEQPPESTNASKYDIVKNGEVVGMIRAHGDNAANLAVQDMFKNQPDRDAYSARRHDNIYDVIDKTTGQSLGAVSAVTAYDARFLAQEKFADKGVDFRNVEIKLRPEEDPTKKPPSRRAQIAKKIKERPTIWRMTDTLSGQILLVAGNNNNSGLSTDQIAATPWAKQFRARPDDFVIALASPAEVAQYQVQQLDQTSHTRQDPVQASQPEPVISEPGSTPFAIFNPVQQNSNELVHSWVLNDREGNTLLWIMDRSGVTRERANRLAMQWLSRQGEAVNGQGPFEVVPDPE